MTAYYVDTSAALKLLVEESHSREFADFYDAHAATAWVTSSLLRVEMVRLVARSIPALVNDALELLTVFSYITVDDEIIDRAAAEPDRHLRSLDALHLASARLVGTDLAALVTYDTRLRAAAEQAGMTVLSPGAD